MEAFVMRSRSLGDTPEGGKVGVVGSIGPTMAASDRAVLRAACNGFRAAPWTLRNAGLPLLSVKLSSALIGEPGAAEFVLSVAQEHGLRPQQLLVARSERAAVHDAELDTLQTLQAAGVYLGVTHIGPEAWAVPAVGELRPSVLEIDIPVGSRTWDLGPVVLPVMALAARTGAQVVATGVDSFAVAAWLDHLGCHLQRGDCHAMASAHAERPVGARVED